MNARAAGASPPVEARGKEFAAARPNSNAVFERARESIPGAVSHNLRRAWPLTLAYQRGEGAYKWDVDGNAYVDYSLGNASLLLGYEYPTVVEALRDVSGIACASHEAEVTWAELVKDLMPGAERVRFTASGTEATMLATRIARAFTGRTKVIHFTAHWHGWHDYYMQGYRPPFDSIGTDGVPAEVIATTLLADERTAEQDLARFAAEGDIAAVILEPSGAAWGTVPIRPDLLRLTRDFCDQHGAVLIFDEMITGFRWSPGGVQARTGITPDLTSLGKVLTGGLPGGGLAGKRELMELLRPFDPGEHGVLHYGTFNAHPVSAAAGVATLREVKTGRHNRLADAQAQAIRDGVNAILADLGVKGVAYGDSSAFHVYLAPHGTNGDVSLETLDTEDLLTIPGEVIRRLHFEMRSHGVDLFSYNGGVLSSAHGDREVDMTLSAFRAALMELRDDELVAAA